MSESSLLPPKDKLRICFSDASMNLKEEFDRRGTGIDSFSIDSLDDLRETDLDADILVSCAKVTNTELDHWPRLKFLQSVSAGMNQFTPADFSSHHVYLAGGSGANANIVSQHAFALLLTLAHHMWDKHEEQKNKTWFTTHRNPDERFNELTGKTMLVIGLGHIGNRICRLAKAFDMHVIGVRYTPASGKGDADEVYGFDDVKNLVGKADVVVVAAGLSDDTYHLVNEDVFNNFNPRALLVNIGRGPVIEEKALINALENKKLAGAGLDVTEEEPLSRESPLWTLPNVVITPHIAGESELYEGNIVDILLENLDKLWKGETNLINRVA